MILDEDGGLHSVIQSGLAAVGDKSSEEVVAACVSEARKRCVITRKYMGAG